MKRNPIAGTGHVYAFSLRQMCLSKGWLISTITIAVLLLAGIPLLLWAVSAAQSNDNDADTDEARIMRVLVVDETEGTADYNALKDGKYQETAFETAASMDAAVEAAKSDENTVILRVTKPEQAFLLTVYLPEQTKVSRSKAGTFADFAQSRFPALLMQKANLTMEGAMLLMLPISSETAELTRENVHDAEEHNALEEALEFLVPFFVMMLLYMMVILYGQSMGNSILLEKNSKLIETMLTAVEPVALMAGKLFAVATAAVMQLFIWIFAGIGGTLGGVVFAMRMVPDTNSTAVTSIDAFMTSSVNISIGGILLALLMIALGFLLYLSLGAVSGALASKAEDLNKTNVVFVLVLVGSMLLCLNFSVDENASSIISDALWLNFFPFTALLTVPGKLVLGKLSIGIALGSLAVMVISVVILIVLAAVIYRMLVLYRGTPPTPAALLKMLKENRGKQ